MGACLAAVLLNSVPVTSRDHHASCTIGTTCNHAVAVSIVIL